MNQRGVFGQALAFSGVALKDVWLLQLLEEASSSISDG